MKNGAGFAKTFSPKSKTETQQARNDSTSRDTDSASEFSDNRPEVIAQRKLQAMMNQSPQGARIAQPQDKMNNSPRVKALTQLQARVENSPRQVDQRKQWEDMFGPAVQREEGFEDEELQMIAKTSAIQRQNLEDEGLLQGKMEYVQQQDLEEEGLLQGKFAIPETPKQLENRTGMPDGLKAGIENLSGLSMDDVKVHYNSSIPAQLNALAYTQGTDIHVGPGQEQHLSHEGWHIVQQKQRRVNPTIRAQGMLISDNEGLEHEADVMGAKAMQMRHSKKSAFEFPIHSNLINDSFSASGVALSPANPYVQKSTSVANNISEQSQDDSNMSFDGTPAQLMPMGEYEQIVQKELLGTYDQFCDYFEQDYIETEAAGGFLTGGVMYGWNYKYYIQDTAFTKNILTSYIEAFKTQHAEMQAKEDVYNEPETGLKTTRIGNQELIEEGQANELFSNITAKVTDAYKANDKTAQEALKANFNRRFLQVILNSVSNTIRDKHWGELISIADIHGQNIPLKRLIIEEETRVGFEIEPGGNFNVRPEFFDVVDKLTNVTLASTDYLEFIIDDLNRNSGLCQIEFRTRPLNKKLLSKSGISVRKAITDSINQFPVKIFKNAEFSKLEGELGSCGWQVSSRLAEVCKGLSSSQLRISMNAPQHVTHSLPISSFLGLAPKHKECLLPGSKDINNILALIEFMFSKITSRVEGNTIVITTRGRNSTAPNIKSGLDLIIGMLDPEFSREAIKMFAGRIPEYAKVVDDIGKVTKLTTYQDLPVPPDFNPQSEYEASFSGEEKLKPLLFDVMRKDLRVLVEHRADKLVVAVNDALSGNIDAIKPYIEAMNALDEVQSKSIFSRWFG